MDAVNQIREAPPGLPGEEEALLARLVAEGWAVQRPRRRLGWLDLRRVARHHELLLFLFWRDLKVKYKQMVLGTVWAVLQPVTQMVLFSLLFGRFAKLPSEGGAPYAVLVFTALLPWQYFAGSLGRCVTCLVISHELLRRVAFPRLVIPMSALLPGLVDFLLSFLVLLGLMVWYQVPLRATIALVPAFLLLAVLTALAAGLWLATLNVRYRDVQYLAPFLIQVWMFATPVAYSAQIVPPGRFRFLYDLNPMVIVVQGFRWAILGSPPPDALSLVAIGLAGGILLGGLWYFYQAESTFADVV